MSIQITDSSQVTEFIEHTHKLRTEAEHPVLYLTGLAGSGKSYLINQALAQDSRFAVLAATTGIASINLGASTVNQVLKYFNTQSLQDAYQQGALQKHLRSVRERAKFLVIDEASMMPFQQLEFLLWALDEINDDGELENRLGLILTGDFAQLPPVPGPLYVNGRPKLHNGKEVKEPTPFAFKAKGWSRFDEPGHTIKLEKIYRQSDPTFLEGINAIRRGVGSIGVPLLAQAGVEFHPDLDSHFDGTTIVAKNDEVDRVNRIRLNQLSGEDYFIPSERWWAGQVRGYKQPSEWQYIPEQLQLKVGAYVMILANNFDPIHRELIYCNGDCGWVREVRKIAQPVYDYTVELAEGETPPQIGEQVTWMVGVELVRNQRTVCISRISRIIESRHQPDDDYMAHPKFPKDGTTGEPIKVRNAMGKRVWSLGQIDYMPMRLAYASTVHKCVSPNTWILTKEGGLSQIKDCKDGQKVFTSRSMEEIYDKTETCQRAYRIITDSGFELVCGEDHPILTEAQGFIEARALSLTDKVRIASEGMNHLHQWDQDVPSKLDPDVAWLLGVLIGDGSYNERKEGQLHIATSDPFMQDRVKAVFEKLGRKISVRSDNRGLHSTQLEFRSWLHSLGLDYVLADKKTIPWTMTLHKTLLRHFLQGLFDTDGSVGRSFVIYCTASKVLSQQVQICLEMLGIPTKRAEYPGARDPYYQIRVSAEGIEAFKEYVGFSRPYKAAALAELKPNRIMRKRGEWDAIKEITDLGIEIPMIDISVAAEHIFVANGIVTHNSQGLSLDRIQIDPRCQFFTQSGMVYVALSRGRAPQGIRVVGSQRLLAERVKLDPILARFV